MAALNKKSRDLFFAIIRKNKYGNLDAIYYQCRTRGIKVNRDKLALYAKKLKKEDATSEYRGRLLRQHQIKNLLGRIRAKEKILLKELNEIHSKLYKKSQPQI